MAALRPLMIVPLLLAALAGCAETDADGKEDQLAKAAQSLEVQATDTTGVIRGVVVDEALRPLTGAVVVLQNSGKNVTTNADGAFGFEGLEAGTYFLTATLEDYTSVQQSVDVVAGVSEPDVVKVMLVAIPRGEPMIEALTSMMFVSGSGWVDGVGGVTAGGLGVLDGNWNFQVDISPNGTVAQTELLWDMTTPLGQVGRAGGGTYDGDDAVDEEVWAGGSPLVMLANATEGGATADNVYYSFYAYPSAGTPVGFQFNQKVEAYIHVFHNFYPREGWTFSADGPHPVPEK